MADKKQTRHIWNWPILASVKKLSTHIVGLVTRLFSRRPSEKMARAAERERKKQIKRELRGLPKTAA